MTTLMKRRRLLKLGAATLVAAAHTGPRAQSTTPVRLVVGSGAGGALDVRARWLADRLGPALGQDIVVENRPGAGGNISAAAVAAAPADGHTLLFVHQGLLAINPFLYARPGFDALKDFVPIARLGIGPLLLVTGLQQPSRSLGELIRLAKSQPGQLSYGSPAIGSPPFMAVELLKHRSGIDVQHVPFGAAALISQVIGGHAAFTMEGVAITLPHVQAGRLRALAVSGPRRLPALPDVPTVTEAGVPGYEYLGWMGLAAPAALPAGQAQRLNRAVEKILSTADARAWFATQGADPGAQGLDEFSAFVRAENARWGAEVRRLGLRLD
jgi:tripartite-type tricarboxylate transporter receptor subunit TctC